MDEKEYFKIIENGNYDCAPTCLTARRNTDGSIQMRHGVTGSYFKFSKAQARKFAEFLTGESEA